MLDAYLDIEATGLSCYYAEITVVGIYLVNRDESNLVQLVDKEISSNTILKALSGVDKLYTYNGSRFDLPFIHGSLGLNLNAIINHRDLMYDCWRCNLKGGFKAVERQLSIPRQLNGISGWDAVLLWRRYKEHGDQNALKLLLRYNMEDVTNLRVLRERLGIE
jgi:uncharacterized protein YprB with RNaseH-like and TPR domain